MAGSEGLKADQWADKFDGSRLRYLQRIARMKSDVRADTSLSDLDRAVLGVTGSRRELQQYRKMAARINELQGDPIVVIEAGDSDEPLNVIGGVITGAVEAEFADVPERNTTRSQLRVPITNGFRWYRAEDGVEDCSSKPFIDIARFDAEIVPNGSEYGASYYSRISPSAVMFGSQVDVRAHVFRVERMQIVNHVSAQFEQLISMPTA
ncbi:MAG TPA: hypothetical protein VHB72_00915 [Candidatus Saccharimonadales bacterium]|nr:hypothetical protein [Candidatus Saccharimonadales bacterium]